jgi:oxygen-independent coproporphyrinogen-3 oxidase
LLAGGTRYHAHHVPNEDLVAELYEIACDRLAGAGIEQYEISNFASPGNESRHNLKYWTRQPYFGFGVDAHSMLPPSDELSAAGINAVRFGFTDSLEGFIRADAERESATEIISNLRALEEEFFLGLRLNHGVNLENLRQQYGDELLGDSAQKVADLCNMGLVERDGDRLRLTPQGRLLSNEVFEKFVALDITEDELFELLEAESRGELPVQIAPKVN